MGAEGLHTHQHPLAETIDSYHHATAGGCISARQATVAAWEARAEAPDAETSRGAESWLTELSNDELKKLLILDRQEALT